MGNSQPVVTGQTKHNGKTGEIIVNYDFFSDQKPQNVSEEQIESSQLDYFSSDQRIEELKTRLGDNFIDRQNKIYSAFEEGLNECSKLIGTLARNNPMVKEECEHVLYAACIMRKFGKLLPNSKPFRCLEDDYIDEMLNVDNLLKLPPKVMEVKFKEFIEDFKYCCSLENSNEGAKIGDIVSLSYKFKEPYSAIFMIPQQIELLKSRYLPNKTSVAKEKIDHELMEPFIYNPTTDTEKDFEQKLESLSQTPYLKRDIEIVKECYQNRKQDETCLDKFIGISSFSELIVCKKDILRNSPQLPFPNIEDAAFSDVNKITPCSSLFKNHFEKLFPDMADFTKEYLDQIEQRKEQSFP